VWPYVEVQAAQAMGNLPALARIMALQEDTNASGIKRIFCGLRSYSRGANFTTTLNASDEQNYAGVTVTPGANTSIVNFLNSPTGRVAEYNPAGADAIATRLTFTLSAALTQEYLGAFHAFLRYDLSGATTTYTVSMVVLSDGGYTDVFTSETKAIAAGPTSGYGIVDLGAVRLPPYAEQADIGEYGRTHIAIQIGSSNGTDNFDIIDLWLMPVDEWAMDAQIASDLMILPTASRFDSLRYPRRILRAGIFDIDYTTMLETFSVRKNGPAILQANARQRLWFLMFKIDITDHEESFLQHQMRVQLFRNQRYFSYRGNR